MTVKTLPAAKVADEILRLATTLTDQDINDVLDKIGQLEGGWGVLWGLEDIRRSGMSVDYYGLKKRVLLFLKDLRKDRHFHLAVMVAAVLDQKGDVHEKGPEP